MLEIAKINSTLLFYGSNIAIPRKIKNKKNKTKKEKEKEKEKETKRKEGMYIRMVKKNKYKYS